MECANDNDEILVEMSNEEIDEFRLYYKNLNDPEFIHVHLYLKNQLKWNIAMNEMTEVERDSISERCKMKIYRFKCGTMQHRTLVCITGEGNHTLFFASLDESLEELRTCLSQTKLIKWNLMPMCVAVLRRYRKMLYEVLETKNIRVRYDNHCSTLWLSKKTARDLQFDLPNNVELREIHFKDGEKINEIWPYNYPGSVNFINSLITLNGGLGIYKGDEIISWVLHIECFGFGLLQTIDEHQGRGYARILSRAIAKKISTEYDEDVILFASYGRPKTVDLYIRYGYEHISYTHWFYLERNE